jgi:hypothetical protein
VTLATVSFSEVYNLFKLDDIRAVFEECLAKHGMSNIKTLAAPGSLTLEASGEKLSMSISLREETIGREGQGYFQGQPRVRVEAVAKSDADKNLAESIDRFRYCVLIRTSRGGG